MKKAFTIVELLMVVAIIAVLIGIVMPVGSGMIRKSRAQRASALCKIVEQGIMTYYAQHGEYPVDALNRENVTTRDDGLYWLSGDEVRTACKEIIKKAVQEHSPAMDISGFFVSKSDGEPGCTGTGLDFWDAVHGTKRSRQKMSVGQMYFGYARESDGKFRRFVIKYSPTTDRVSVRQFTSAEENKGGVLRDDTGTN